MTGSYRSHFSLFAYALLGLILALYAFGTVNQTWAGAPDTPSAPAKGPHNGLIFSQDAVTLELAIVEQGAPPRFKAWVTAAGEAVAPSDVTLKVELERLDGTIDRHQFSPGDDALHGDALVYEPHSFVIRPSLTLAGRRHDWMLESFEGRTRIKAAIADSMGIQTAVAGGAVIHEQIAAYGRLQLPPEGRQAIRPRFAGVVTGVQVAPGDVVTANQVLFTVESNSNLQTYTVRAPRQGMVLGDIARVGDVVSPNDTPLAVILDDSVLWAQLAVFPQHQPQLRIGQAVTLTDGSEQVTDGTVDWLHPELNDNQSQTVRVVVDNTPKRWRVGQWVEGSITINETAVELAVQRDALQTFRDFDVVFEQIGEDYEVRMLTLGRGDDQHVEVRSGLKPGARYVTQNSYIIKADIEKAGAAHDH